MSCEQQPPLYIKLNAQDNVAIVANSPGLKKGAVFPCGLELQEDIPEGHKAALTDLAKGAAIILGTLVVLIFIIFVVFGRGCGGTPAPRTTDIVWVRPQPNERTFDIVAKNGPVTVKLTSTADATIYYQGTIQPGDKRTLPRRVEMLLEAAPYSNIALNIDGKICDSEQADVRYRIVGPTTVKAAR